MGRNHSVTVFHVNYETWNILVENGTLTRQIGVL